MGRLSDRKILNSITCDSVFALPNPGYRTYIILHDDYSSSWSDTELEVVFDVPYLLQLPHVVVNLRILIQCAGCCIRVIIERFFGLLVRRLHQRTYTVALEV